MIFLTAVIFSALLFLIPGEMLLITVVRLWTTPGWQEVVALAIVNLTFFGLIYGGASLARRDFFDIGWERDAAPRRLAEWLDVTGWGFLSLVGLVGIGGGAAILVLEGRLPYPFWFLFAAIAIGFLDVFRGKGVVALPKEVLVPRYAPEPTPDVEPTGKKVEFVWEFMRGNRELVRKTREFVLAESEYEAARGRERFPRRPVREYVRYVQEGFTPSVRRVAMSFREETVRERYSPMEEAMNVIGFARGIPYASDEESKSAEDYASFPIETLYERLGDCEDHAIVTAAVLHHLGHDVGLFHLALGKSGHLALGYRPPFETILPPGPFCERADNGRDYYYVETVPTSASAGVGEISEQFLRDLQHQSVVAVC